MPPHGPLFAVLLAASGGDRPPPAAPRAGAVELALLSGGFAVLDDDHEFEVGLEGRFRPSFLGLRPIFGATAIEGGQSYLYVGVRYEHALGHGFHVAPSLAAGVYDEDGGIDLGGPIQFRSALEIGWRPNDWSTVGLVFYHLSNASLYDSNSGSESLVLGVGVDVLALIDRPAPGAVFTGT
jgi:hypothetical protein